MHTRMLALLLLPLAWVAAQPATQPERIILTWQGDPATSMSVSWRTAAAIEKAQAQIAVADDGPKFADQAQDVAAATATFTAGSDVVYQHTARFTGLKPDTVYVYRVGGGKTWSEWNQFRTAAGQAAPLTFLYSADAQNDIFSEWSRVIRAGFREAPKAQFIVHAGDLVNAGPRDDQWGEWFRAAGWINAMIPSVPTPGNHEYAGGGKLTAHWRAQFDLPENGIPGLEESNYYLDIQGVRMISLNSYEKWEEQAAWLDQLLSNNPNRWTVLVFHYPVFSTAKGRDNKKMRETWQPVFDKHAVDLVLTGHDHTYGRSGLEVGPGGQPGKSGTVYVASVAGPKMYRLNRSPWMRRAAEDTQLIQVIRIDGNRLHYQSFTAAGRLYDAFELRKRPGKANELIDQAPKGPERVGQPEPAATAK